MIPNLAKNRQREKVTMKTRNVIAAVFLVAVSFSCVIASPVDDAKALFAKGDYLAGMNILTKETNATDHVRRAQALLTYGSFYEDLVGNPDYAVSFYENVLRLNLPENDPLRAEAIKKISGLKLLRIQYSAEDNLLKKLKPAESANDSEKAQQIQQLLSIVQHKPDYYKLSEVYYQLGRNYFATDELYQAYVNLKKSLTVKPAINYYLPVNVWIDASYQKLLRVSIHAISWGMLGGLLIVTAFAFYLSRPWRWLKFKHIAICIVLILLWFGVYAIGYFLLVEKQPVDETTLLNANAAPPYFVEFGSAGPFWNIIQTLFVYGILGTIGLFVFSIGTSRIKRRWAAGSMNFVFAILLFSSLATVFYLRNCDQKSLFASAAKGDLQYYAAGGNYFVTYGMEPYILTNPKAYPNLAMTNISDPHMRDWILKNCPFTGPGNH
jgi:tetratricopeptide (TPR) repeat protein